MTDDLTLNPLVRSGARMSGGAGKSERHFLDFVINGRSLWKAAGKRYDNVSILCAEFQIEETTREVDRLLLRAEADIPNGRRSLFVCAECGDLGCGAITALVVRDHSSVIWKGFGRENNYENEVELGPFRNIGPFAFDAAQYQRVLMEGLDRLKSIRP